MTTVFGGRYETTGQSLAGGTGIVYVCRDPPLGRLVAIKFLGPYREKRRMHDEVSALQSIRSPNVVELFDVVIETGNNVGLVEEYLSGPCAGDPAAKPTTTAAFIKLIYQMSNGVADIHAAGLIHRDIKPSNMKYTSSGILKILDFDLARTPPNAHTVGFRGTPGYAAPELYLPSPSFDAAIDVFALAASSAAIILGSSPFKQAPPDTSAWLQAGGFAGLTPSLPVPLVSLLDGALAINPSNRPAAAQIRDVCAAHLLTNRHRALLVHNGTGHYCDFTAPTLTIAGADSLTIRYTGTAFVVAAVGGHVFINNSPLHVGEVITGSCVLSFGAANLPAYARGFFPLDISHPEVVL